MPRPRRKPFWRWTPLPWLVLLALMLATGTMGDLRLTVAYAMGIGVTVLLAAALAIGLVVSARRRSPNFTAEGRLARLEGLELVHAPATGLPNRLADVDRHKTSIDAALARSSAPPAALLIPDAGSWWNLRLDVAVYLIADNGFHHVGRLSDRAQVAWQGTLDALRAAGRYAVVPATVTGVERRYIVEVSLDGLKAAV
jgi:hypothetical protein